MNLYLGPHIVNIDMTGGCNQICHQQQNVNVKIQLVSVIHAKMGRSQLQHLLLSNQPHCCVKPNVIQKTWSIKTEDVVKGQQLDFEQARTFAIDQKIWKNQKTIL